MAKAVPLPPMEVLNSVLIADFDEGRLFWKKTGLEAFTGLSSAGYHIGCIARRQFRRSRVLWKMHTGQDPIEIDHINGVKTQDHIENLRDVTRAENLRNKAAYSNNLSKSPGLTYMKRRNKWRATIKINGKLIHVGIFNYKESAASARELAARRLGFHPNHGRQSA